MIVHPAYCALKQAVTVRSGFCPIA